VKADGADSRKWCRKRGLEEQRFYEMNKLKRQFQQLLGDHGLIGNRSREGGGGGRGGGGAGPGEDLDTFLPPAERKRKHAERKQLAQLKDVQRKQSKKRKVLKMNEEEYRHVIRCSLFSAWSHINVKVKVFP